MACATKFTDELAHAHGPHRSAYEYQRANYVPGAEEEGERGRARACVCFISFTERYTAGIVGYSVGTRRGHGIGEDVVDFNGYARGQRYTRVHAGSGGDVGWGRLFPL